MAKIIVVEAKEAATVYWKNTTGSAVASGDLVELGADPNQFCGVAVEDIANGSSGSVAIAGRVKLSADSGNGGVIGTPYFRSASSNAVTISNMTTLTAFVGYGASSITSTDASGTKIEIDLAGPGRKPYALT